MSPLAQPSGWPSAAAPAAVGGWSSVAPGAQQSFTPPPAQASTPPPAPPRLAPASAAPARSPLPLSSAPVTLTRQPARVLARAETGSGGSGGAGGGGSDSDAAYHDFLRRVREEQEQIGQLIPHPF